MQAKDIILNIAVNLGRLSRWVYEGKVTRVEQFLEETDQYLNELKQTAKHPRVIPTLEKFQISFSKLKNNKNRNIDWAEEALTWANILNPPSKACLIKKLPFPLSCAAGL